MIVWATFARQFFAKNFQKSLNLVTLRQKELVHLSLYEKCTQDRSRRYSKWPTNAYFK